MRPPGAGALLFALAASTLAASALAAPLAAAQPGEAGGQPSEANPAEDGGQPSEADPRPPGAVQLLVENDTFAGLDRWFSHHHALGLVFPLARVGGRALELRAALGQAMYTPRNIQREEPPARDHPFAGHLYLELGATLGAPDHTLALRLRAGVVGPAAGGGQTQDAIHTLLGVRLPRGWDTQLPNQAAVDVALRGALHRRWRLDGVDLTAALLATADVGNASGRAGGAAGLMLSVGLPARAAAGFLDPTLALAFRCPRLCAAAFLGAAAEGVWLDLFTEARGLDEPPAITRRPWRATFRGGLLLAGRRAAVRYVHVRRSRTFSTRDDVHPRWHRWGALELLVPFG